MATVPKKINFAFKNYEFHVQKRTATYKFLNKLFPLAMRTLSVPATSAPVERVFSHGGIIMCPHRAQLSNKLLSNLIFLKCNQLVQKINKSLEHLIKTLCILKSVCS